MKATALQKYREKEKKEYGCVISIDSSSWE